MDEKTEVRKRRHFTKEQYDEFADRMLGIALNESEWRVSIASMARRIGIDEVLAGHLWRAKVRDKIELSLREVE